MKLKLQLVQDDQIIFEVPLSPSDWSKKQLENEFNTMEESFQKFSRIFDALSNQTRLRMMMMLLEEEDRTMSFSDFMRDLDLNPKIVWQNSKRLRDGGFLKKTGRGQYSCSEFGQRAFIMMSLTLRRLAEFMEEIENR